ncbi:MAG: hypothetical protein ISN29_07460 [Gammaproteobacteria bacterium AqS3]|nr:hypothetical protein [Gammaproteobacteria bacterium AqS3]
MTETELRARLIEFVDRWGLHDGICDIQLMVGTDTPLPESNDPEIVEAAVAQWRATPGAKMLAKTLRGMGYKRGWVEVMLGGKCAGFVKSA